LAQRAGECSQCSCRAPVVGSDLRRNVRELCL
jgi:hypothetical protein